MGIGAIITKMLKSSTKHSGQAASKDAQAAARNSWKTSQDHRSAYVEKRSKMQDRRIKNGSMSASEADSSLKAAKRANVKERKEAIQKGMDQHGRYYEDVESRK